MRLLNRLLRGASLCAFALAASAVFSQNPPQSPATPPPQYPPAQQPAPTRPATPTQSVPQQQPAPVQPQTQGTPQQSTPAQPQTQSQPGQQQGQPGQQQGQEPSTNDKGLFTFSTKVEEVQLYATVVDDKGRMITDLPKEAFQVYENGQPREIRSFHNRDIPVSLGIVIDNSGSMRDKRQKVNTASLDLVRASNPQDQVFIVNFNDEYYLDQDFTSSITQLQEGLEHIESRGGTALYDAVIASADHLKRHSKLDKKIILVVTDGEDNSSRDSLEQTVRRVSEEGGPTIYAIGILGDDHAKRSKRALEALAERTGGLAFFPKDVNEVDQIAREIAKDIRNQYTIAFKKDPNATPGYKTIKVVAKAPGHKNLQVRTQTGYYAGPKGSSSSTGSSSSGR